MAVFTSSGTSFSLRSAYTLYIQATTSAATGGTRVDINAYVMKAATSALEGPWSATASKSFSMPGARITSPAGATGATASATWSYDFRPATTAAKGPIAVWSYTRYYAYSAGTSVSMSLTAADASGGLIGSATESLTFDLFQPPGPTPPTSVSATGTTSGINISWSGAGSDASYYGIWWNTSAAGAPSTSSSPDFSNIYGTSYSDTGVAAGSTRYYWVKAYNSSGTGGAWSTAYNSATRIAGYDLTIDPANGGSSYVQGTYTGGSTQTSPAAPSRTGYTFNHWTRSDSGTVAASTNFTMPSAALKLTASWTINSYTVSYNSNGGSPTPTSQSVDYAASFTAAAAPARSGYNFNYWVGSNATNYTPGVSYTMPASNLTLTASWTAPAPSTPTGLYVSGQTTSRLTLNWNTPSGVVSGYTVYLNGSQVSTTSANSYTFTGLSANTSYTLGVSAYGPDAASSATSISGTTAPVTFTVPNVVGQSQSVATNTLTNIGFGSVSATLVSSGATLANNFLVISQSPLAGTTSTSGSAATINVYNYLLSVPSVLGLTESVANTTLSNAGFYSRSSSITTSGATVSNNLTVGSQTPTGGTQYNPVNTVSFTIYNFLTTIPNVVGQALDTAISNLGASGFTQVTTTLTEVGATIANVGTVKTQSPATSATTYNPKNQPVSLVIYSLGVTGKRYTGTSFQALTTAKRFNGTSWVQMTVAKRFDGTQWKDITN